MPQTLSITLDTDNAAFGAYPAQEVERILARVTEQVRDEQGTSGTVSRPIRDTNGNTVGEWTWVHDAPEWATD